MMQACAATLQGARRTEHAESRESDRQSPLSDTPRPISSTQGLVPTRKTGTHATNLTTQKHAHSRHFPFTETCSNLHRCMGIPEGNIQSAASRFSLPISKAHTCILKLYVRPSCFRGAWRRSLFASLNNQVLNRHPVARESGGGGGGGGIEAVVPQ